MDNKNIYEKETLTAKAPYNFIPFAVSPLMYTDMHYAAQEKDALPWHDKIDPDLKTGEIHLSIDVATPLFISDGNKNNPQFVTDGEGRRMIPGSSLRGAVRENMQILGFAKIEKDEDVYDEQYMFRSVAAAKGDLKKKLDEPYKKRLGIVSGRNIKAFPRNIKSGYLYNLGNDQFVIYDCKYWTCQRKDAEAYVKSVSSKSDIFATRNFPSVQFDVDPQTKRAVQLGNGSRKGFLYFPGYSPKRNNQAYMFEPFEIDKLKQGDSHPISEDDIRKYREDLEFRRNSLKGNTDLDDRFWNLPKEGKAKPVFYLVENGQYFIGRSPMIRIGYKHSTADGLPKYITDKRIDFVHGIMGFIQNEGKDAYRSRVFFEDFKEVSGESGNTVKMVLGGPKPTFFPAYVSNRLTYNDDGFTLRGYKVYWQKQKEDKAVIPEGASEEITTTLRPAKPGTRFQGVIRFTNLYEDELGLLLWALKLETGCYQSLGMAKPYGYGRCSLSIDRIVEYDFNSLYTSLDTKYLDKTDMVDFYIQCYQEKCSSALKKKSITLDPGIQNFFLIKRPVPEGTEKEFQYLDLPSHSKVTTPLPTIDQLKEQLNLK